MIDFQNSEAIKIKLNTFVERIDNLLHFRRDINLFPSFVIQNITEYYKIQRKHYFSLTYIDPIKDVIKKRPIDDE